MNREGPNNRVLKLAVLAAGGLVLLALAWWWLQTQGGDFRALLDRGMVKVRDLGAPAFFVLMALLPAAGCPLSVFTLPAGSVFAPVLGMPLVLVLVWLSIAVNLAVTYWLARYAFRPWLERFCGWLGYALPQVAENDQRGVVFLVRVTPGPPYVLQSYLLGLAGIPFATYFFISWVISSSYACAFVLFGDALMNGRGKRVLMAIGLFVILTVTVQLLRRYYRRKRLAV
ncbi:MAG: VTT domain-containing protein [Opitutaceae bacterium]|nr:VTT domain-containing protein [Opitutaceae bacterium]MBP9912167.1 VTT domain-containing protein [Opitutaceae bacterium]